MLTRSVDAFLKKMERCFITWSWIITILVTLLIVTDVILRWVFNAPLPAAWEMSEVAMPYIVLFGLAYTLTNNSHVRVSIVTDLLSAKIQIVLAIFVGTISFLLTSLMTYGSWLYFLESYLIKEEMLAAVHIPWWIGKIGMPLAFGLLSIRYLIMVVLRIREIYPDR
jgi:TRAP-type C4-dicarboxylate transport system permease small subunit